MTNHGRLVAFLVPPTASVWEVLRAGGKVRPARRRIADVLDELSPATSGPTTAQLIDELRGDERG